MLLASLFSLVYCLGTRPGAYPRAEHLKGVSLGWAPDIAANTILFGKGLQGMNTLAYYENFVTYDRKKFYYIGPRSLS